MRSLHLPGMDDSMAEQDVDGGALLDTPVVKGLGQYPTPVWLAEAVVERYFSDLNASDCVLEPTCGEGHFLQAIPAHVAAYGVEIDPAKAAEARVRTGRQVITGDILTVPLDIMPTAIIGNPPFDSVLIQQLLARAHELLPDGGRCGLLLPAYLFQTASRVMEYAEKWSMQQEMIPRNVFEGLSKPLIFTVFSKDAKRTLVGFAFYREADSVLRLKKQARAILDRARTSMSVWRQVVDAALADLGGEASVSQIYAALEGRRPTENHWHREKVRQTLGRYFVRVGDGRYSRPQQILGVAA